jgi:hypothetical protein
VRFETPDYDEIRYDPGTKPNYPDPATQPYQRLAFGWTQYDKYTYGLSFVRYYAKGLDPKDYPWIVGVMRVNANDFTIEERLIEAAKIYTTEMNFPVYADSDKLLHGRQSSQAKDPFMSRSSRHLDMQERIDAFVSGSGNWDHGRHRSIGWRMPSVEQAESIGFSAHDRNGNNAGCTADSAEQRKKETGG